MPGSSPRPRSSGRSPRAASVSNRQRKGDQVPSTVYGASLSSVPSVLVKMLEACKKHSMSHDGQTSGVIYDEHEPLPDKCRRNLDALRTLLPEVEEAFLPPPEASRGPKASDVSQICKIYWLVLSGDFCPHSLVVFNWGRDYEAIFGRVHKLYQHLTSDSILEETARETRTINAQQPQESLDPVAIEICFSIAHFLNLIPQRQIQHLIVRDLITLAFDLATIAEANILQDGQANPPQLELVLFVETMAHIYKENNGPEYTLRIASMQELLALQAGTFAVLDTLLTTQKDKRVAEIPTESLPSPWVDCYFFDCLSDDDLISTLLGTARQMLSGPSTRSSLKGGVVESTLTLRNWIASLKILGMLLHDLECSGGLRHNTMVELSLLIAEAVLEYIRSVTILTHIQLSTLRDRHSYTHELCQLVCDVILFPSLTGGDQVVTETLWSIRSHALIPFLDCVEEIGGQAQRPHVTFLAGDEMALRMLVLRTIHACVYTESPPSGTHASLCRQASNHCTARGIYAHFFSLLNDVPMSNVAIAILSKLADGRDSDTGPFEFKRACRVVWLKHAQQRNEEIDTGVSSSRPVTETADPGESNTSNSKRRSGSKKNRSSSSPKEKRRLQLEQLQIQRSPKRRRYSTGASLHVDNVIATPPAGSTRTAFNDTEAAAAEHSTGLLDSCIVDTLQVALESSSQILSDPEGCWELDEETPGSHSVHNASKLGAVLSVTSACRLVLNMTTRLISQSSACGNELNQVEELSDLCNLLNYMLRSLRQLCMSFLGDGSENSASRVRLTPALRIVDLITSLGLQARFDLNRLLEISTARAQPSVPELKSTLDVISLVALTSWTKYTEQGEVRSDLDPLDAESHQPTQNGPGHSIEKRFCSEVCNTVQNAFSSKESRRYDTSSTSCLCSFSAGPNKHHTSCIALRNCDNSVSSRDFQNDCAMFIFDVLAPHARWTMLSCLHPFAREASIHEQMTEVLPPEFTRTDRILMQVSSILDPSKQKTEKRPESCLVSAISGLPILLLSLGSREWVEGVTVDTRSTQQGSPTATPESGETGKIRTLAKALARSQILKFLLHYGLSQFTGQESIVLPSIRKAAFFSLVRMQAIMELASVSSEAGSLTVDAKLKLESPHAAQELLTYVSSLSLPLPLEAQDHDRRNNKDPFAEMYHAVRLALVSARFSDGLKALPPAVRLQMWKSLAWTCLHSTRSELEHSKTEPNEMIDVAIAHARKQMDWRLLEADGDQAEKPSHHVSLPSIVWLIVAVFADSDPGVRDVAARNLGHALLGNSARLLFSIFSTDDVSVAFCSSSSADSMLSRRAMTPAIDRLFRLVDNLLCLCCGIPQSQLSFTVGSPTMEKALVENTSQFNAPTLVRRSAVCALSSLCFYADTDTIWGVMIFEKAFLRLLRFWTLTENPRTPDGTGPEVSLSSLAFGEISRLDSNRSLRGIILGKCRDTLVAALFSEMLMPHLSPVENGDENQTDSIAQDCRERQYHILLCFARSFLIAERPESPVDVVGETSESGDGVSVMPVLEFLDEVLPSVLPTLVVDQDYDALRLVTGFRLFLLGIRNAQQKLCRVRITKPHRGDSLVGGLPAASTLKSRSKLPGVKESSKELNEQTKVLCAHPKQIHHILPKLFLHPDREPLVFFLKTVLKAKLSLYQILQPTNHKLKLLKALAWQLGSDEFFDDEATMHHGSLRDSLVVQALHKAALAMESGTGGKARRHSSLETVKSKDRSLGNTEGSDAASRWVSSSFMFLLVNVVQHKWKFRSSEEKIRAMRCLKATLHFLIPSEASQYTPQIMTTVNMALSDDDVIRDDSMQLKDVFRLRLLAVHVLSHFVRIIVGHQAKSIGSNLTSIVVSMFPVLSPQEQECWSTEDCHCVNEATKVAVSLLEWLTDGDLGKQLAPLFNDIPFLPPSQCLDTVRASLKANGVSFDNLLVLSSTPATQGFPASAGDSTDSSSLSRQHLSSYMQAALHQRLVVLGQLLSHENFNVRRVVLRYLTDLLHANRLLWHRTIENHDGVSAQRLVTVDYSNSDEGCRTGSVAALVRSLLTRCVLEDDVETRTLLATALGEIGAIDSVRIGDTNAATVEGSYDDSWRLSQPPWQSSLTRYELRVVTKHLVVALKASPTPLDQHKVAFAIQQLLVLLDIYSRNTAKATAEDRSLARPIDGRAQSKADRGSMSEWLTGILEKEGVLEVVEPFWSTSFTQSDSMSVREPPFFRASVSYFQWISRWCGFMVKRSKRNGKSPWQQLFFACRTAIRSMAGICVAEFIFPLLVLDSLCFGDDLDRRVVLQELSDALTFTDDTTCSSNDAPGALSTPGMNRDERQKAVNASFIVIDTLEYWAEREFEDRYKSPKGGVSLRAAGSGIRTKSPSSKIAGGKHWEADVIISTIDETLRAIPLSLRASAAAAVGMHARALRFLEMAGRSFVVDSVFNHPGDDREGDNAGQERAGLKRHLVDGVDGGLLKHVLFQLDDCYTMNAVGQDNRRTEAHTQLPDTVRQREAYGDWAGAIQEYERALQLNAERLTVKMAQRGMLRCLLELGQFESVLNQTNGIISTQACDVDESATCGSSDHSYAIPSAVEAAWRLGRWSVLENLVKEEIEYSRLDAEGSYQISIGRAMLGLAKKSIRNVDAAVKEARSAVMTELSSFARESYSRSYCHLLRLHCLREIENASERLCTPTDRNRMDTTYLAPPPCVGGPSFSAGFEWDARLDVVSSAGATTVMNVRLALARLAGDPELEAALFLTVGKNARKNGLYHIAENSLALAETELTRASSPHAKDSYPGTVGDLLCSVQMQLAKLKHARGESDSALRILDHGDFHRLTFEKDDERLKAQVARIELEHFQSLGGLPGTEQENVDRFAKRLLQSTQWMAEGGLKGGAEVIERFRLVQRLCPKLEKASFYFAKHVDSLLECRLVGLTNQHRDLGFDDGTLRSSILFQDPSCQRYLLLAMKQYGQALQLSSKHVYQALPRLLTLWFDFTSINADEELKTRVSNPHIATEHLERNQRDANQQMLNIFKPIPPQSFYTAMPQLVSRVTHRNKETCQIVLAILGRVLSKFPLQAMWSLAWLRNSITSERSSIGDHLFKEAQKCFSKSNDKKRHDLLVASKTLFRFLIDIAKHQPKGEQHARMCTIRQFIGEVDLMEFVPPVQAALCIAQPNLHKPSSRDVFPSLIPRMRAFSTQVQIMSSKARPKKVKAFVVPSQQLRSPRKLRNHVAEKGAQKEDIGEMHFLVKQEAKGDLRKDARVQDLNNVINRLFATSSYSSGGSNARHRRRLQLRTFSVVCLSEECGILEWVPHTESLRSLVSAAYNPQAELFSLRRRGRRLANFGDVHLRKSFEDCQTMYKDTGHLIKAASMFDDLVKEYPPVLYWWFVQNFLDPHAWYEARTRFTMSAAAWSAVGHVIGLGDRHSENILVDKSTGDCVHVDFDCIFDKGLNLPQPELVPFRLTQNMLDAFGPVGADGMFNGCLKTAMSTLRGNRDTLLSVLEPFLKDPVIDWKRHRSQQKGNAKSQSSTSAKRSIKAIDGRLKGIYNLKVHSSRRVKRTDGRNQQDDMTSLLPLSVEGQVHKMIAEATNSENLVQVYVGWMPWL